ncbi:rim15, signal transduction response regulator [Elasticomyces elasticus]|nr:rim15, signal transduction response regulator [Elasticomyces elasticus]
MASTPEATQPRAIRQDTLTPPTLLALKREAIRDGFQRGQMERTISMDIREEREDLQKAAEQTVNCIMDLDLEGHIRWVSPSWEDVVGIPAESVRGKAVCDLLVDNPTVFADAVDSMRKDDSKSQIIRLRIVRHAKPTLQHQKDTAKPTSSETQNEPGFPELLPPEDEIVALEAQGIMVRDRDAGSQSHTMWMIKPSTRREITIDLPEVLVESLGVGAEVLANYLTLLAEVGLKDPENHPPPLPILCRICERSIVPWWFEKHSELCLQEHKAEMEVQMSQEHLNEHRNAIVKILDALEVQARYSRPGTHDTSSPSPAPPAVYKGMPIGPTSTPSSGPSSGRASPATPPPPPPPRSRDSSSTGLGHHRTRSFAVRRPLARIIELILDLCDTALEISTPAIKDTRGHVNADFRSQSPQSESRISQVLQWQSPSAASLEQEQGLSLLCDDTAALSKGKVEAIFRHRRIIEYSERIRVEFDILVQECIDAAMTKAARLAAGDLSDSSEEALEGPSPNAEASETIQEMGSEDSQEPFFMGSFTSTSGPSAMAMALRNTSDPTLASRDSRRDSSAASSSRSNSPRGSKTPRSHAGALSVPSQSQRGSIIFESDAGGDSDGSVLSSVASVPRRSDSPSADLNLKPVASSRERKRRSLVLPSLAAVSRNNSPARGVIPPSSPLHMSKARLPSGLDGLPSPITSPVLSQSEFSSPVIRAQTQHHHRRQSSVMSDAFRGPLSPRLTAVSNVSQPRAVQPSIKDFEIIKPISKGAFGSVYLSKKKSTGDYYAVKVLKKADMVAKNQVTNVKAERAIMMWQGESDFVAKLYWTFSSKDYLYLVMEYLNGGDCASLIKVLGGLPEDWAKKYLAEVVLGVEHLHSRQIVHRDLKPDNLLIDQKGHLKLTDFGLSRMGLIGRQKRLQSNKASEPAPDLLKHGPFRRATSVASSRSTSFDFHGNRSPGQTPSLTPFPNADLNQPSYFSLNRDSSREPSRRTSGNRSDSGDSDALQAALRRFSIVDDPIGYHRQTSIEEETCSEDGESPDPYTLHLVGSLSGNPFPDTSPAAAAMLPPPLALFDPEDTSRKFVGTPDYLAPETINGAGQDEMSDWWSLGCILFECLYGYPPFHADSPDGVFQNILDRKIHWPGDDDCPVSEAAKDLMHRLMCSDPTKRLGANLEDKFASGGDEIRHHPWFSDVNWSTLREDEASFVPAPENPEDTEYFDARGATLQNFAAEFEDQASSPANTPGADYPDRPHDALSRVRNQVNSMKRNLMPLHIPPHVRDGRSRRLSEPVITDDFGNFQFKNLPVLEKANKDVIQKLRAEAMLAQSKAGSAVSSPAVISPAPSLDSSPLFSMPLKRTLSANKGTRPASPLLTHSNPSPHRASQPSSPLLVSFSTGQNHERRKTSSGSSTLSHQTSSSLQPGNFFDVPRLPINFKSASSASSPIKIAKPGLVQSPLSHERGSISHRQSSLSSPRARSHTVGSQNSQEGDIVPDLPYQHKRRSQVFDVSPSSSDNEDPRQKALLRVQRRRQSSRRLSQITLADGPFFRPLDVLICEDHPVSRLVMERLLEKLRCRTISVQNGTEAMRIAMSDVKFDIIMMEFKLPHVNGADVARMIRDTRNANSHTPIVAVTGYLKELQDPHHFDALMEKPPTTAKLTEVMGRLCQWRTPPPGWMPGQMHNSMVPPMPPSNLRQESVQTEDSPTTSNSSGFAQLPSSSYQGSSREDSIGSSSFGEVDSQYDSIPVIVSRQATDDWRKQEDIERRLSGLGISSGSTDIAARSEARSMSDTLTPLTEQLSAPALLEGRPNPRRQQSPEDIAAKRQSLEKDRRESSSAESGDDEDEELGNVAVRARSPKARSSRSSKLGTEMLRTNSEGSVVSGDGLHSSQTLTSPLQPIISESVIDEEREERADHMITGHITPPEIFPRLPGEKVVDIVNEVDATPRLQQSQHADREYDPDPTPRASTSPSYAD